MEFIERAAEFCVYGFVFVVGGVFAVCMLIEHVIIPIKDKITGYKHHTQHPG